MENQLEFRSDIPCKEDLLGFDKYVATLCNLIQSKNFKTPFCIGIFGDWGTGKTSFMQLLQDALKKDQKEPHTIPVWFNPWRYQKEDHLIIPFLKTIEYGIEDYLNEKKGKIDTIAEFLKIAASKTGQAAAAFAYGMKADCKMGPFGISIDASKMVEREQALEKRRLDEAANYSRKLDAVYYNIIKELKDAVDEKMFRIAVFIDDLDRCLPEKAVELLESIKLFLDIEGYLFVLGVAKDVVEKGISYRYRHLDSANDPEGKSKAVSPEDYLEKMIQLPLELPPIEAGKNERILNP